MSYECHITTTVAHAQTASNLARALGWKTSEIKRDPVLGDDSYFYLTTHHSKRDVLTNSMSRMNDLLVEARVPVLRLKIEHIVFDTKTGVDVPGENSGIIPGNDPFADVRGKRMSELTEEQADRAHELWLRENAWTFGRYYADREDALFPRIFRVINRLRSALADRGEQPE